MDAPGPANKDSSSSPSSSPHLTVSKSPVAGTKRSPSPAPHHVHLSHSSDPAYEAQPTATKKKRLFTRELRYMMHGFGDDPNPYSETVDLLEDLVIEFITETTTKAMEVGKSRGKVHVEDIIFLIRKDAKKYSRVKDLLMMNEELKKARKAFDETAEL